ncbi:hypothetical protein ACHAPI_011492 [Fusarium lateritium]
MVGLDASILPLSAPSVSQKKAVTLNTTGGLEGDDKQNEEVGYGACGEADALESEEEPLKESAHLRPLTSETHRVLQEPMSTQNCFLLKLSDNTSCVTPRIKPSPYKPISFSSKNVRPENQ